MSKTKIKCAYYPNEDVTKRKCILKPCSSCLHNELIQVDNNEAGDDYEDN